MIIGFSKPEIKALRQICQREGTQGQLAAKLQVTQGFVSQILQKLAEKGIIDIRKEGVKKIVRLSTASHAQNFKLISDSRRDAKIENWLSGYAMDILVGIQAGESKKQILKETDCSRATLYKCIAALISSAVLNDKAPAEAKESQLAITEPLMNEFVISYADNLELNALREIKGRNLAIFRIGKHVILRTDAKEVPDYFTKTGSTALAENGLEAMLPDYYDYYYNLDKKKREISLEESFIHALLITSRQHKQDLTVLTIYFAKNRSRLEVRALRGFAKQYRVNEILNEVRGKTEFYNEMKDKEL